MLKTRPELSISPEKICFIIGRAHEFDLQDLAIEQEENANEEAMRPVLEDAYDPAFKELCGFINALTEDEQIDLVALTWLGRGDGTIDEWEDLREEAARAHNKRTAAYLLGKPFLPDHLAEGLIQFGTSCPEKY